MQGYTSCLKFVWRQSGFAFFGALASVGALFYYRITKKEGKKMNSNFYLHKSDRAALKALKAIPGFSQFTKAYMKFWHEKMHRIGNMSGNLRINEKQLSKYYDMLVPICSKLEIEVPELYLTLDVTANAGTYGYTKPYIIINSGLLETIPEELVPTVLAHECGHIACGHCLYTTMGRFLLNGTDAALKLLGLSGVEMLPIKVAFAYWMRCSELSADRAAAVCDGNSDKMVELCMRFAGFDKDVEGEVNIDEFMNQALDYLEMVKDSKWNKTLEFLYLSDVDHPLNAVRAYECSQWCKTDSFDKITNYINSKNKSEADLMKSLDEIPMDRDSKTYSGENIEKVHKAFCDMGFSNVVDIKTSKKGLLTKDKQVLNIKVDGNDGFDECEWLSKSSKIELEYYDESGLTEEASAAHPGQLRIPDSTKVYLGREYMSVLEEIRTAGFMNIELQEQKKAKKGLFEKDGKVTLISVNGQTRFSKDEWFDEKAKIIIVYQTFEK